MHGLKCKLGLKGGENIWQLADAPNFFHTASPQLGSGLGSKPSKHSDDLKYDLIDNKGVYSKGEEMLIAWFKMQIRAKMKWKYKKIGWHT